MKSKIFFLILTTFLFSSCENEDNSKKETKTFSCPRKGKISEELQEISIDDCQYLYGDWGNATVLTHKGNCNNKYHYKNK